MICQTSSWGLSWAQILWKPESLGRIQDMLTCKELGLQS